MAVSTTKEASYDVFLSFRGPDSRNKFIGHLHKALVDEGIRTFKDDRGIERGENIESELHDAIRDSKISLIVFSQNYASSRWCLDELVQILHQHRNTTTAAAGNIILPIFYHVDPSDVRKQRGSFANAFERHEEQLNVRWWKAALGKLAEFAGIENEFARHEDQLEEATVEWWRAALRDVADLGGLVLKDGDESKFIQEIVEEVSNKLSSVAPYMEKQGDELEKRLRFCNRFINDAEIKQYNDVSVKEWLDDLRNVIYDAEDVIDDIATEALFRKLMSGDQSQTSSSFPPSFSSNPLSKPKKGKTIREIKEITQRFDKLEQDISKLGLVAPGRSISSSTTTSVFREMTSLIDESCVYGRNDDKDKIIDMLLLPKESTSGGRGNEFSIIPIVGMGGVGKTTLAQMVYHDNDRLKDHFPLKAWVCVSNEFDVEKITRTVLNYVRSDTCKSDDVLDQLQIKLKNALTGKKFLIVLDDVWDNSNFNWDLLRKPFAVGAAESAIIVTTRDRKIASIMGTVDNYYLQPLSEDDCWSVFADRAFRKTSVDTNSKLVGIGKEIVRKCKGLPLAAKSLGGLLSSTEEEDEWENVLKCKLWNLPNGKNDILPVLKLSYYYLSSHLKRCFAYCSIFPKNYELEEEMVVFLWMSEGFLEQPEGEMDMEGFAHNCFRELLLRSFFQPSSSKKGWFVMHDLMSDLAVCIAGKTCFRLEDLSFGSAQFKILQKARHSSYIRGHLDGNKKFEAFNGVDHLRTFLPLKNEAWVASYLIYNVTLDLLQKFKFLRVFSLQGYRITELPDSIGDLKHLRYLDLSYTHIRSLPKSVSSLYNLQTLLLHRCDSLKKLPGEMTNLINLRHLHIDYVTLRDVMPLGLGRLTNLRKLSNFVVGTNSGSGIGELMDLKHLRGTLEISMLENVIDAQQAREAKLSEKKGISVLIMDWCSQFHDRRNKRVGDRQNERIEKEVLNMLRPNEKLKELTIRGYGGTTFPSWLGDSNFSNMVLLKIEGCERCTALPPLGQLPLLRDLHIKRMNGVTTVGHEFYGEGRSNPFPSLETLRLEDMEEWREWLPCDVEKQGDLFASLHELSIVRCPKLLGSLPDHLPSLVKLVVSECKRLTIKISSLPRLCELEIRDCQEVVQGENVNLGSLETLILERILKSMFLTNRFIQRSTGVQSLYINGSDELVSLWQKEEEEEHQEKGLPYNCMIGSLKIKGCKNLENLKGLHNLKSIRELTIENCSRLVSFPVSGLPAMLRKLSIMKCSALKYVILWHNCSNNTSLEYFEIEGCDSLISIARNPLFSTVKELKIRQCASLKYLVDEDDDASSSSWPSMMMHASSSSKSHRSLLEVLHISECPSLLSLSSSKGGEWPATLKRTYIAGCPKLELKRLRDNTSLERMEVYHPNLESFPEGLHNLRELNINFCDNFVSLMDEGLPTMLKSLQIYFCPKLESIGKRNNKSLENIHLSNCGSLKSFPEGLHNLRDLRISYCKNFVSFPEEGLPTKLENLELSNCAKLESIGEKLLQNNTSLRTIDIKECESLKSLPENLRDLTSLSRFIIYCCPSLVRFPNTGLPSAKLRTLRISWCSKLEALPDRIHDLTSLEELKIIYCRGIVSFPEEGFPTSITSLDIMPTINICKPLFGWWGLNRLTSLRELEIDSGYPDLVSFPPEPEPEEEEIRMVLPSSLIKLKISRFQNLERLSSKGFQNLTSLEELSLYYCPKLQSLPEKELLPSLLRLQVRECPLLKQRCEKDRGPEWSKISNVFSVQFF